MDELEMLDSFNRMNKGTGHENGPVLFVHGHYFPCLQYITLGEGLTYLNVDNTPCVEIS